MNRHILRGLSAVGVLTLATSAHAALPEGVNTGVAGAQTDSLALIGLLATFGAAVFLIAKVLRRFGILA